MLLVTQRRLASIACSASTSSFLVIGGAGQGSNLQPLLLESSALPIALPTRGLDGYGAGSGIRTRTDFSTEV
jgi:hypothetical protein